MNATATALKTLNRINGDLTSHAMNGNDSDAMRELCVEGITTLATLLGSIGGGAQVTRKTRTVEADEDEAPKRRGRPKGSKNSTKAKATNKPKAKAASNTADFDDEDADEFIANVVAQALKTGELPNFGRGRPSPLKVAAKEAAAKALRKAEREAKNGGKAKSKNKAKAKSGSNKPHGKGKNKRKANKSRRAPLPA